MRYLTFLAALAAVASCKRIETFTEAERPQQQRAPRFTGYTVIDSVSPTKMDTVNRTLITYDAQGRLSGFYEQLVNNQGQLEVEDSTHFYYEGNDTLVSRTEQGYKFIANPATYRNIITWHRYEGGLRVYDSSRLHYPAGQRPYTNTIVTRHQRSGDRQVTSTAYQFDPLTVLYLGAPVRHDIRWMGSNGNWAVIHDTTYQKKSYNNDTYLDGIKRYTYSYLARPNPYYQMYRFAPGSIFGESYTIGVLDWVFTPALPASEECTYTFYDALGQPLGVMNYSIQWTYQFRADGWPSVKWEKMTGGSPTQYRKHLLHYQ